LILAQGEDHVKESIKREAANADTHTVGAKGLQTKKKGGNDTITLETVLRLYN